MSVPVQPYGADVVRGVRLTRRGRVVVVGVAAGALLACLWVSADQGAVAVSAADATHVPVASTREEVTVGSGDTLWAIAVRARPEVDPRVTVQRIMDVNSLADPIVHPGQRLLLPSR